MSPSHPMPWSRFSNCWVFVAASVVFWKGIPIKPQDFATNPQVQQGLKNAFLRLAGLKLAADAVTLNWACAGEALAKFASKLRRLGSEVRLCFEIQIEGHFGSWNGKHGKTTWQWTYDSILYIRHACSTLWIGLYSHVIQYGPIGVRSCIDKRLRIAFSCFLRVARHPPKPSDNSNLDASNWQSDYCTGEKESLEACEVLVGTSPTTAAQVIQEELEASNVAEDIDIIRWSPEPNPLSLHPNTQITQSGTRGHAFTPPSAVQFSPPATVNPGGAGWNYVKLRDAESIVPKSCICSL